ncbi:MAG: class I SAM-dependent methyltransferase [Thermomicrobiales bacterium]
MATETVVQVQPQAFDPARYKQTTHDQWQVAAEAWHRWTPAIQDWLGAATEVMFDLAGLGPGQHVLDVAAGAGEPSISAAKRVAPGGSVLATDISANILDYARKTARARGVDNLETRAMDGEHLELPDATFDAVISRVGLIYFPDQQQALREARRVLKPGGRVAAIVYTTPDKNQFFSIPVGIIRRRAQLPPPLPGQPGPFSLGGEGALADAFARAAFTRIETRVVPSPVRMASAAECVRFERESFGALHQMLSGLPATEQAAAWDEITRDLSQFETASGFVGPCEMIVGVGVKES